MLQSLILITLCCTACGGLAAADSVLHRPGQGQAWGYLGDGSGVMDAKPPLEISEQRAVWKAPLPQFGLASPIVVEDRVFVLCEPRGDQPWPELLCLSVADGKELWRYALNHLPATELTAEQQQQAQRLWSDFWRKSLIFAAKKAELNASLKNQDEARMNELTTELTAQGIIVKTHKAKSKFVVEWKELKELGSAPYNQAALTVDTWAMIGGGASNGSYVVGEAFATPISDGIHVYAVTAYGGFFCLDMNGKAKWIRHYPGVAGEYCRNGRSPIIWKDLLLCDITARMRGIDRATGALKWSAEVDGHPYLTPAIVKTKGGDAVLCGRAEAFSLPDGRKLKMDGVDRFGCTAITKYDEPDIVFFQGGDEHGAWGKAEPFPPMAARFSLEGDILKGEVLWHGINGKPSPNQGGIVYYKGKVYTRDRSVLDAATGEVLVAPNTQTPKAGRGGPPTEHLLLVANDHVFGVWANQRNLPKNSPHVVLYSSNTLDGDAIANQSSLPGYNYASTFALSGDCTYIRTNTHLWCIR